MQKSISSISLVIILLGHCVLCEQQQFSSHYLGTFKPIDPNSDELAKVDEYVRRYHYLGDFPMKIEKAEKQIANGFNYRITYEYEGNRGITTLHVAKDGTSVSVVK